MIAGFHTVCDRDNAKTKEALEHVHFLDRVAFLVRFSSDEEVVPEIEACLAGALRDGRIEAAILTGISASVIIR